MAGLGGCHLLKKGLSDSRLRNRLHAFCGLSAIRKIVTATQTLPTPPNTLLAMPRWVKLGFGYETPIYTQLLWDLSHSAILSFRFS